MKLSLKQIHSKINRLKSVMLVQRKRFKGLPLRGKKMLIYREKKRKLSTKKEKTLKKYKYKLWYNTISMLQLVYYNFEAGGWSIIILYDS